MVAQWCVVGGQIAGIVPFDKLCRRFVNFNCITVKSSFEIYRRIIWKFMYQKENVCGIVQAYKCAIKDKCTF